MASKPVKHVNRETRMYADLVRYNVKWRTSYGKGGIVAPVDFDVGEPAKQEPLDINCNQLGGSRT